MSDDASGELTGTQDEILLREYAGSKAEYYLTRWARLASTGRMSAGFNGAAFGLSGFWLLYRKMFRAATLLFGIILVESIVEDVVAIKVLAMPQLPSLVAPIVTLAIAIVVGRYGTYWYYRQALRKVAIAKALFSDRETQIRFLRKRGGGSVLAIALGVPALLVCCGAIYVISAEVLGLGAP